MIQPGFNLRAYGILLSDDQKQVLLIDETVMGKRLIKFPGGGVEAGEGPGEALIREFQEELGIQVRLGEFFYVSPNYHLSFFRPQQLVALYWWVKLESGQIRSQVANLNTLWTPLSSLDPQQMTHNLDKEVVTRLLAHCGGK